MATKIRKVNYVYIKAPNRPGQATRVLTALRDANVNLLAFSGFPEGRGTSQIDLVTDDLAGLKRVARREGWKLSRTKRAFLVQGTDKVGAAVAPVAKVAAQKINVIAADAVTAGMGRFGMLFWVAPRHYARAAKVLGAR
jgi:ACT domain